MASRSKSGKILVRVGSHAVRRAERNAAMEKAASDRAIRRAEKKARTAQNSSMREIGKRAAQIARRLARDRATYARRLAKRKEKEAQRSRSSSKPRRKRPYHPRGDGATEKYNSYARRLERSKKLNATRASPTTFSCNGYTIKVTAGANPKALSCTCADFTQVEGGKNWKGSNAGPFNPCKHMMAVKENKWKCLNGVCTQDSTGVYNSEAECQAALVPAEFTGGQCVGVQYRITGSARQIFNPPIYYYFETREFIDSTFNYLYTGKIQGIKLTLATGRFDVPEPTGYWIDIVTDAGFFRQEIGVYNPIITTAYYLTGPTVVREDGLPDTCGNPNPTCPI